MEMEVLQGAQPFIQTRILKNNSDRLTDLEGLAQNIESGDRRLTGSGRKKSTEDVDRGRLAGPVGSQKAKKLPCRHLKGEVLDSYQGAKTLDEMGNLDHF